ncbi:MAG TPA: tetratricopeptide repeat protein [Pyrinomonadaceae bacterium]|nr:tetratricopeptide repeat protein [Pyrinomonadaceae bacterium]
MRNAERYLAQGKIQSAIGEYKQVVANDPKDFGTLNMLGDLYTKTLDRQKAVKCYTPVAEHYSKQGFAQKAIAVYNKISKIEPDSIDIFAKLADLYKFKGSINEARVHYTKVAEHHEQHGQKVEALEVRKQIASLDPNDTSIYLNLAEAYLVEKQDEEALAAFVEAGARFAKQSRHSDAIDAFRRGLEIDEQDPILLSAFSKSHIALGTPAVGAEFLARVYGENPHNREALQLLIDCQLEAGNTTEAEKAVVALVEKDPSNYPKFLALAWLYLRNNDGDSAARVMAMSAEHVLLAGQVDEFQTLLAEILRINPEQLEGLRLRARLCAWQRDDASMRDALIQLNTVARTAESVEDERFALSQLVMILPQETAYADRLREINQEHGFEDEHTGDNMFDQQFMRPSKQAEVEPTLETFAPQPDEPHAESVEDDLSAGFAFVQADAEEFPSVSEDTPDSDDARLLREIDSIRFYIDNGYGELASKAVAELRAEFGSRAEIDALEAHLNLFKDAGEEATLVAEPVMEIQAPTEIMVEPELEPESAEPEPEPVVASLPDLPLEAAPQNAGFGIDDLRSELGLDEPDELLDDSDYETHYHTAVAYQEMGLLDDAVKEFQEAVALVQPNDPMRRFFHCANLLGHCFMEKSMPNLALKWYLRALETPGLNDDEKQGIWYELAAAYEADGDIENAGRYFEQVYAENIDYRDVSQRVKNISVPR